jgi:hypothetical protein
MVQGPRSRVPNTDQRNSACIQRRSCVTCATVQAGTLLQLGERRRARRLLIRWERVTPSNREPALTLTTCGQARTAQSDEGGRSFLSPCARRGVRWSGDAGTRKCDLQGSLEPDDALGQFLDLRRLRLHGCSHPLRASRTCTERGSPSRPLFIRRALRDRGASLAERGRRRRTARVHPS